MSYTYLTKNRFMSEISNYHRLSLGETEKLFIIRFTVCSPYSAYDAYTDMKKIKPMSYKNVHNKIRRLVALGLLQEEKGTFKRNAIKYKLTTRGLLERFLIGHPAVHPMVFELYQDNIILQTILYPYFEHSTIQKFADYHGLSYIMNYLTKCCDAILETVDSRRKDKTDLNDTTILWLVTREAINLIFNIVVLSNLVVKNADKPNITSLFPISALTSDKKFMGFLLGMKNEFDSGYKKFVSSPNIEVGEGIALRAALAAMIDSRGRPLDFKSANETL